MNRGEIPSSPEIERLRTLLEYGILDTPYEEDFNGLAQLASTICETPIALISMIDDKRQWYKAKVGIARDEVPRKETFCQYTIEQDELFEIEDATKDNRVSNNPNVTAENGIRYYAGLPLTSEDGYNIGTLCVVDIRPRQLSNAQKEALSIIAKQVMLLLEFRRRNKDLGQELEAVLRQKIADTEKELSRRDAEYNFLYKAINKSSGIVEFSPEGYILRSNKNFEEIIGYTETELQGQHHSVLMDQQEVTKNQHFWDSLQQGKYISGRFKRMHKSGTECWIQASYNPILDEDDKVVRIIKIAQNITGEVESTKVLERAKQLADDLNIQKDYFIANMSHEIRTPINTILGFAELLESAEEDEVKRSQMQAIQTAGDNLLYLVNDILDLSKIEAGIFQIDHRRFELRSTVASVFSILQLRATQKKLAFNYTIQEEVPEFVLGDKNRLTQILMNLLGNSIKFTHKGTINLTISIVRNTAKKCTLQFVVSDTGIGIDPTKLESIFERFTQAEENTSRKYGGTGLGLNITKLLVEKQGGKIRAESKPGQGSSFTFTITYTKTSKRAVATDVTSISVPANTNVRVLLCEDNLLNQRLVQTILQDADIRLDIAENGKKGLELLRKNTYDVILMDVQMPEMNGYDATKMIRGELGLTTPIIALTAHSMVAEREKCLTFGMSDYLSKPFRKNELIQLVRQWSEWLPDNQETKHLDETIPPASLFSLKKLHEYSGGDPVFEKEMISIFLVQSLEIMDSMKAAFTEHNLTLIADLAHKLKNSFGLLDTDLTLLNQLEEDAKTGITVHLQKNLNALESQITALNSGLKRSLQNYES